MTYDTKGINVCGNASISIELTPYLALIIIWRVLRVEYIEAWRVLGSRVQNKLVSILIMKEMFVFNYNMNIAHYNYKFLRMSNHIDAVVMVKNFKIFFLLL